jgi:hypothetical protein
MKDPFFMRSAQNATEEACEWLNNMLDGIEPERLPTLHEWLQEPRHVKALADAAVQNQSMRRVLGRMERSRMGTLLLLALAGGVALGLIAAVCFLIFR